MVGEVVTSQGVEPLWVVVEVGGGQGGELPVQGGRGAVFGPGDDTFSPAGRRLEEADQLTDGVMAVQGMAKRQLVMDLVLVAASGASLREVAGVLEIPDQLRGRSFRHADGFRDVSEARAGVGGNAHQHMRIVGDKPPNMVTITGNTFHEK